MQIETSHLGVLEYNESNVINFMDGLPGFEDYHKFIIVLSNDAELPFHYLQSVEKDEIAFIITDPFLFVNNYDFNLSEEIVSKLEIESVQDISVYTITTIPDDVEKTSINIAAPCIVNNKNNLAKQVIVPEIPTVKYFIFDKGAASC
ncbi:flagellar assembly protein FliW [Fusibacter ferrireducens]|uniref:Flagellar assembly factor FliW n=1 Tax=Fusibacter ferrireducens TaxID=2785058 RepID=A0ABR9ZY61_9FIRM|nr:flagellar assembly protein FliW [Fusibacter ferrireducens]MBF4694504.1 flagellar assembly protein FliW [Fusibacter ferrireducens]